VYIGLSINTSSVKFGFFKVSANWKQEFPMVAMFFAR